MYHPTRGGVRGGRDRKFPFFYIFVSDLASLSSQDCRVFMYHHQTQFRPSYLIFFLVIFVLGSFINDLGFEDVVNWV